MAGRNAVTMLRGNQLGKEGHPFLRILFGDGQQRGGVHDLHQQDDQALQGLHGNIGGGGECGLDCGCNCSGVGCWMWEENGKVSRCFYL